LQSEKFLVVDSSFTPKNNKGVILS